MTFYDLDLAHSYQDILATLQEADPSHEVYRDLLAQKIDLERTFIRKLKQLTPDALPAPPWSNAEADFAYNHQFFGQGVTSLVVELAELPEHQKDRLLKERLGEKTFYRKKEQH